MPFVFPGDSFQHAGIGRIYGGSVSDQFLTLEKFQQLDPTIQIFPSNEYTMRNLEFSAALEPDNPMVKAKMEDVASMEANGDFTIGHRI